MPTVEQILHNIADHIIALRAIFERDAARGEARARLLRHILDEEQQNRRLLAQAALRAPPEQQRAIQLAIEHSHFLEDIIRGEEIEEGFALELLEHFQEEHDEGFLSAAAAPAADDAAPPASQGASTRRWTVGSLRAAPYPRSQSRR